jgi:hypothetical protein
MADEATMISGIIIIEDLSGYSLTAGMRISPFDMRVSMEWMQDCFPCRLKGTCDTKPPTRARARTLCARVNCKPGILT